MVSRYWETSLLVRWANYPYCVSGLDPSKYLAFSTSEFGQCMLIGERVLVVAFVDNIIFWATDEKYINDLGAQLCDQGRLLEEEGDAAGFLGVTMTRDDKGDIELK